MQAIDIQSNRSYSNAFAGFADDLCRCLFRVEAERTSSGDFAWGWKTHDLGEFQLTDLACDPVRVSRSPRAIASGTANSYFVTLQLSGCGVVVQNGQQAFLEPGDFTLIDGDLPYRIEFEVPVQRLILKIPKGIVVRRLDILGSPLARRFSGERGMNAVFANYLASLAHNSKSIDRRHLKLLSETMINFLTAALDTATFGDSDQLITTNQATLIRRVQDYITLHLADPELSPQSIASQHKITERYLHSLFSGTGTTVASWIRDRRLERCKIDLENPRLLKRTVSETCYIWGFNDLAHFSRKFKEKYGISPRDVKATAKT